MRTVGVHITINPVDVDAIAKQYLADHTKDQRRQLIDSYLADKGDDRQILYELYGTALYRLMIAWAWLLVVVWYPVLVAMESVVRLWYMGKSRILRRRWRKATRAMLIQQGWPA